MVLIDVNTTTEFLRIILTGKIDIEADILFFISEKQFARRMLQSISQISMSLSVFLCTPSI